LTELLTVEDSPLLAEISPGIIKELLEDKTSYGETFFVPVRARWNESWTDENGQLLEQEI
jgi:hypothetical protein